MSVLEKITNSSINRRLYVAGSETTAYSSSDGSNNAYLRLINKNGTDNTGVNNHVGIEMYVATGATSVGMLSMVRTGNNTGDFTYKTRTGASTYAEHFRITATGKIGINNTSPTHPLHISKNTSGEVSGIKISGNNGSGDGGSAIHLADNETVKWSIFTRRYSNNNRLYISTAENDSASSKVTITEDGKIGINATSPGSMLELNAAAGTKMGISLGAVGDNITASRYIGICKSADQTDLGTNSGFQGIEFGGPSGNNEGYLAFHSHDLGVESGERMRITKDGKLGVGLTSPESKVQIRNTTTYGKDTYATANTGGSQTPPPGTFKWDNVTPVAGHGRGYKAHVQSGDAYPNASNYIDVLIRNAAFYHVLL